MERSDRSRCTQFWLTSIACVTNTQVYQFTTEERFTTELSVMSSNTLHTDPALAGRFGDCCCRCCRQAAPLQQAMPALPLPRIARFHIAPLPLELGLLLLWLIRTPSQSMLPAMHQTIAMLRAQPSFSRSNSASMYRWVSGLSDPGWCRVTV